MNNLKRGQERYNIYCSPCHSRVGDGRGIMINKGYLPPPSFHIDRIREMPDGQVYDVITNGVRNMPSYRHQVNPGDRWAIVTYVRALQKSRNATISDIPEEKLEELK
jgi:mono/diheme cytochrome c family protein